MAVLHLEAASGAGRALLGCPPGGALAPGTLPSAGLPRSTALPAFSMRNLRREPTKNHRRFTAEPGEENSTTQFLSSRAERTTISPESRMPSRNDLISEGVNRLCGDIRETATDYDVSRKSRKCRLTPSEIRSFLDGILLSGDIVVRSALDERN